MANQRILIVGSGIAGISAAEAARKQNPEVEILVLSRDRDEPYNRPRLFDALGEATVEEKILLHDKVWYDERRIELRTGCTVEHVLADKKTVVAEACGNIEYGKLILCTGSSSFRPPTEPFRSKDAYTVWTLEDLRALRESVREGATNVVVAGGGLLGLEAAYRLKKTVPNVAVLEVADRLLPRQLDPEASAIFREKIESLGIRVYTGASLQSIEEDRAGNLRALVLEDGQKLPADKLLISCGVRAVVDLGEEAGVSIDRRIVVNEKMETGVHDIYAAGDAAVYDGKWLGLWSQAKQQGAVAGTNAAGGSAVYVYRDMPYMLATMETKIASAGTTTLEGPDWREEVSAKPDSYVYVKKVFDGDRLRGFIAMNAPKESAELQKRLAEDAAR